MASPKLVPFSTVAALQAAETAANAVHPQAAWADANGKPVTPQHPLISRNPGFRSRSVRAVIVGLGGILIADTTDVAVAAALPAQNVAVAAVAPVLSATPSATVLATIVSTAPAAVVGVKVAAAAKRP